MKNEELPVFMLSFLIILGLTSLVFLIIAFKSLVNEYAFIGFYLFMLFICWIAYKNMFLFLYALIGDEIIEIHQDSIVHIKQVWKLKQRDRLKKSKIRDIKIFDVSNSPAAKASNIFGHSNISIKVKYGLRTRMLGKKFNR